jgi:hypothetical protein
VAPFAGAALAGLLGTYTTTFVLLGALTAAATALSFFTIPAVRAVPGQARCRGGIRACRDARSAL